ncbi:putative kinesin [Leptomonas seymouri]|uniref:Putative kinesin n=1 Tax=Leptomonas seymouri TaxID=5684 RepID=A0A0N0P5E6_LEPSE|nr:putative kinesin [Leptomonas seymouri]|eukprot:KPI86376.1 putative kinesin [Leptomonas seymouri]
MPLPLIHDRNVSASRQCGVGKRQVPASLFNGSGLVDDADTLAGTSSGASTVTVKRDVSADFRIIVAARIRPFTEREVRQWRQERCATSAQEDAEEARRARLGLRQPFGPHHKSLNATQITLDGTSVRRHDEEVPAPDRGFADLNDVPHSVVEVESDGKTVVLLNAQSLPSDGGLTITPVRNVFKYDYVYSSFAPNVELDAQLLESGPGGRGRRGGGGGVVPYVIMDGDDAEPESTHAASPYTPAQEEQAEVEQLAIYEQLAIPLVEAALQWYNTCMFAYGQTGSGKTYTMMGTPRHPGLIPRLCRLLFAEVASRNAAEKGSSSNPALITLQLSYMEIYNEQVRDLLKQRPKNVILRYKSRFDKKDVDCDEYGTLKVRHHPLKGIYVDGLTSVPVRTWDECETLLQLGNALRTQCSTALNAKSSRSHAIFQLQLTQRESTGGRVRGREVALETFSKINLVDLAGSERNTQAKTTGKHLTEANSINTSLSTLRRVLDGLIANRAITQSNNEGAGKGAAGGKSKKGVVIPFRESLLTYVLSDNLGGNSFTVMCANVSPCAANAGETESTLRYATLAKSVVNHAKLNEAPTARVIREMRDQLRVMQEALRSAPDPSHVAELEEGVMLSKALLHEMKDREENYEAQLHQYAEQAEALRLEVEVNKRKVLRWRQEAQRQHREVEELRGALLEATQNGLAEQPSARSLKAKGNSSGSDNCVSGPLDVLSLNALKSSSSNDLQGGVSDVDAGALRKKKSQKSQRRLPSPERGGGGSDSGLLSPASRDWKPARARGTPLSLMDVRSTQRPSRTFLPALPGAPASAPVKGLGACESRDSKGCHSSPSSSNHNTIATTPPSVQLQRLTLQKPSTSAVAPRSPVVKPSGAQVKHSKAREKQAWKVEASEEALTDQKLWLVNGSAVGLRGDDVLRAAVHNSAKSPPFFQTEQFLTRAAETSPNTYEQEVAVEDDGDRSADKAPSKLHLHRSNRRPEASQTFSDTMNSDPRELLDLQLIQEQAQALCKSSTEFGGGLEIEGVATTPSKQWPTHPPRVAATRQAQAARDRHRSSSIAANTAAAAAAKKQSKATKKKVRRSVSREAPAEPASARIQESTAVNKRIRNAQQQQFSGIALMKQAEQDEDVDADSLTSGVSRSPYRDEELTDTRFGTPEGHEEREDSHTRLVSADGDEGSGTALPAATLRALHLNSGISTDNAAGKAAEHVPSPSIERFERRGDPVVDELCADDTESIAASVICSGNSAGVVQQGQKKKKKKNRGVRAIDVRTSAGGLHYSTVDILP